MLYRLLAFVLLTSLRLSAVSFERINFAEHLAYFEENLGQTSTDARYLVRGSRGVSFLTGDSLLYVTEFRNIVSVRFTAAGSEPQIEPLEPWPGVLNRFGGGQDGWKRNIPVFRRLQYKSVQPNVDLVFSQRVGVEIPGASPGVTFTAFTLSFVVQPGGQVASLFLENTALGGSNYITPEGAWAASAGIGGMTFSKPQAWQESAGGRTPIDALFVARSESRVGIEAGAYDSSRPLTIEVEVLNSLAAPSFARFAVDVSGNFYTAAVIDSEQICRITTGGTALYCPDAVIAAFGPDGHPIFMTTLAGLAADSISGIATNAAGEVVVAGLTDSEDFPITADALQPTNAGPLGPTDPFNLMLEGDLFLARLDARTGELLYSTFFGGPQGEGGPTLAVGPGGVALAAATEGNDFPTTSGAWAAPAPPPCSNNCNYRQVVARFDASIKRLEYSTYVPGALFLPSLALHSDGSLYLAGSAQDGAFTTPGSLQPQFGGVSDAYLLRIAPDGSRPLFATYFGGSQLDSANGLVLDDQGNAGLLVSAINEGSPLEEATGQFAWIAADGSSLLSTQPLPAPPYGSPRLIRAADGAISQFSPVYSAVRPTSDNAPLRAGCASQEHWYLTQWGSDGAIQLATYLPQQSDESSPFLAAGPPGVLYLQGRNAVERIDLIAPNEAALQCVTGAASRKSFASVSPGEIITLLGAGMGPLEGVGAAPVASPFGSARYPQVLAGVRVWVDRVPAPLLYVQASQINAVVPYETPVVRQVLIEIEYEGRRLSFDAYSNHGRIGLFSLDGSGIGPAAALNQDGTLNSEANPAARGSIVVLYGTGIGPTNPTLPDGGLGPLVFDELGRPNGVLQAAIDYAESDILYAGSAPGLINGAAQFNLRIPAALSLPLPIQKVPVDIRLNGAPPQNVVTIWVRQ
jgi:uncharacterized protein (TIGR03437 family)